MGHRKRTRFALLISTLILGACTPEEFAGGIIALANAPDLVPTGYVVEEGVPFQPGNGLPIGPVIRFRAEITNVGKTDMTSEFEVTMRVQAGPVIIDASPSLHHLDGTEVAKFPAGTIVKANGGKFVTHRFAGGGNFHRADGDDFKDTKYSVSIEVDGINASNDKFEMNDLTREQLMNNSRPVPGP